MNDKVIFRGNAMLRILYLSEDGGQYAWDFDLPFTQYAELEKEYGDDSEVLLIPCVTASNQSSSGGGDYGRCLCY